MKALETWRQRHGKPLLLRGARQTGKTWVLNEFGKRFYDHVAYVDLLENSRARALFDEDYNVNRIVSGLEIETGQSIDTNTLIVLDEIQESARALTSLKYFAQNRPDLSVAVAGSYLGIAKHEGTSFPVGKVETLTLHPLSFNEFLRALNQEKLADILEAKGAAGVDPVFNDKLNDLLRAYLIVGGMPEAVAEYRTSNDVFEVRRIQKQILSDYDLDFSKHAPLRILERMRMVWKSLPSQLAKENSKFVYGTLRQGARERDFDECIQWLIDYGAVTKVSRVSALRCPLSGYEDRSAFKLYSVDVGLLGALARLDVTFINEASALFTEFKGAYTEQYACQQLIAQGLEPYYWSNEKHTNEIDFILDWGRSVLPIEVKASTNLQSKSLKAACQKYELQGAVRSSLAPYKQQAWLTNLPLWALCCLSEGLGRGAR